ncbi:MAG: Rep family protein [Planifilum sp.]|jgi:hypothetical protein
MATKARYWSGVLYPENMRSDWKDEISRVVQLPYAYCVHDKDVDKKGELRKAHVHLIVAFPNTTTQKSALDLMQSLSAPGKKAISTVEAVKNIRFMYDYIRHDTADARKQHKHLYEVEERVCGNGFDIGSYEQISLADKRKMLMDLVTTIKENDIYNFADLTDFVVALHPEWFDVLVSNSGFLDRLMNGRYHNHIRK